MKTSGKETKRKTLKQRLEENERLFRETGHLFGLKELRLKEKDPLSYNILWNTLENTLHTAFETAKNISGSVILMEAGDAMWSLFTPTGDTIATSLGINGHIFPMSRICKNLIRLDYEEDPGFREGDIFENNLSELGAIHPSDVYDIVPLFWKDELVGWVGSMNHCIDIGGIMSGSTSIMAPNLFSEAFHVCLEKVGSNYEFHKDYVVRVQHCLRLPSLWMLDAKARVGGAVIVRDKALELIEKYGLDYYKKVTEEFIEDGRRNAVAKIKRQCVPGRLRKSNCQEMLMKGRGLIPQQQVDYVRSVPAEVMLGLDGRFKISLDGASSLEPYATNCAPDALAGMATVLYANVIGYDMVNGGTASLFEIEAPAGTWANPFPVNPWAATVMGWVPFIRWTLAMYEIVARSYFSGGFREEVVAAPGNPGMNIDPEGINQYGQYSVYLNLEVVARDLPARGIADGDACAWSMFSTSPDQNNLETYEAVIPYIYLGRNIEPDSSGFGKYRGGLGYTSVFLVMNTPGIGARYHEGGQVIEKMCVNQGLYGAIPPAPTGLDYAHRTNIKELAEARKPLIHSRRSGDLRNFEISKLKGDVFKNIRHYVNDLQQLKEYDLIVAPVAGSEGLGDPIERDPELVKKDLDEGGTFPATAKNIYCVEASFDDKAREWQVDYDATNKRREQMRQSRKSRGIPFKEWWGREREKVKAREMREEILAMLRSSMQLGPRTAKEIREFWNLPSNFTF